MATSDTSYDLLLLIQHEPSVVYSPASVIESLPAYIALCRLTSSLSRIGLITHGASEKPNYALFHGWLDPLKSNPSYPESFASLTRKFSRPRVGSAPLPPSYVKSALALAYDVMSLESTTLVILFARSPPHTRSSADQSVSFMDGYFAEQASLREMPGGSSFSDWVTASRKLADGDKRCMVFPICVPLKGAEVSHYAFLAHITGGAVFTVNSTDERDVERVTLAVLLTWMGSDYTDPPGALDTTRRGMRMYKNANEIDSAETEIGENADSCFRVRPQGRREAQVYAKFITNTLMILPLTAGPLLEYLPKKDDPIQGLAKRYSSDNNYRAEVRKYLPDIMGEDFYVRSEFSVLRELWTAVISDEDESCKNEIFTRVKGDSRMCSPKFASSQYFPTNIFSGSFVIMTLP